MTLPKAKIQTSVDERVAKFIRDTDDAYYQAEHHKVVKEIIDWISGKFSVAMDEEENEPFQNEWMNRDHKYFYKGHSNAYAEVLTHIKSQYLGEDNGK